MAAEGAQTVAIETMFKNLDTNGDGKLYKANLRDFMKNAPEFCQTDLDEMWSHLDRDSNGFISFDEFVNWVMGAEYVPGASDVIGQRPTGCTDTLNHATHPSSSARGLGLPERAEKTHRHGGHLQRQAQDGQAAHAVTRKEEPAVNPCTVDLRKLSDEIMLAVESGITDPGESSHDKIYQGAGLQKLLADAEAVKPIFDKFCEAVAKRWTLKEMSSHYIPAMVKSLKRSEVKVRVGYNGQITKLGDTVRGTICIDLPIDQGSLKQAYRELHGLVEDIASILPGVPCKIIKFKDRYQCPSGSYRDWQFKLKINDFLCEMQVNFQQAIDKKEATEHRIYELDRMAEDSLLEACMCGDRTAALLMLKLGVVPRITDSNGCTPLHYGALYGDLELCSQLIAAGASTAAMDCTQALCIHRAIKQGSHEVTNLLLSEIERTISPDVSDELKLSLVTAWELLLRRSGFNILEMKLHNILTTNVSMSAHQLLMYAARGACFTACKKLLCEGASANRYTGMDPESGNKGYPLDFAISAGASSIVRELVSNGGKIRQGSMHEDVQVAAEFYVAHDRCNAIDALFTYSSLQSMPLDDEPMLVQAAKLGTSTTLRSLLRRGVKLSCNNEETETRLLASAAAGNLAMVELLLDANVDPNVPRLWQIKKDRVSSPLSEATEYGHLNVMCLLLDRRADINFPVKPAAHAAVSASRPEALQFLHDMNADFSLKCVSSGRTVLEQAQKYAPAIVDKVKVLLESENLSNKNQ